MTNTNIKENLTDYDHLILNVITKLNKDKFTVKDIISSLLISEEDINKKQKEVVKSLKSLNCIYYGHLNNKKYPSGLYWSIPVNTIAQFVINKETFKFNDLTLYVLNKPCNKVSQHIKTDISQQLKQLGYVQKRTNREIIWKKEIIQTKQEYVYFVLNPDLQHIKIGYTTDIKNRLTTLQTASSSNLELFKLTKGNRQLEKQLHKLFAPCHIKNEWFNYNEIFATIWNIYKDTLALEEVTF